MTTFLPRSTSRRPAADRWLALLADFKSSGLSIRQFCRCRGVSEPCFYLWRKRLMQDQARSSLPAFVPLIVPDAGVTPHAPLGGDATIELRGGRVLRLSGSMPARRVAELVQALEDLG